MTQGGIAYRIRSARRHFAAVLPLLLISTMLTPLAAAQTAGTGAPELTRPTKFKSLPVSMETLLDSGWQIVSLGAGIGGYVYLLKRDQKWITCATQPEQVDPTVFLSQCAAMN